MTELDIRKCGHADIGFMFGRCKFNNLERAFAEAWQEANIRPSSLNYGGGILSDLFHEYGFHLLEVKDRERFIVATVIQWLGTNVGFSFLQKAFRKEGTYMVVSKDYWQYVRKAPDIGNLLSPEEFEKQKRANEFLEYPKRNVQL